MKKQTRVILKKHLLGGIVFVLLILPLPLGAQSIENDPYRVRIDFTLRPLVEIAAAPYRFLAFIKEQIDAQSDELTQKSLAILRLPYDLTQQVKNNVDQLPKQVASLLSAQESTKSQITNYKQIPNPNDQISKPVIAIRQLAEKQSQIQDTKYMIQNTKEIIREIVVKESPSPIQDTKYKIQDTNIGDKLTALRSELTDSFAKRINTLVGGFGFQSNRFDDLFVQKSLELQGKLNQPASVASSPITFSSSITSKDISATSLSLSSTLTVSGTATSTISGPLKIAGGLTAGSGNVQIIDSTGKIPALSSSYFQTLPSLFSSIGNASSTVQFSANQFQDTLSFEGIGGTTISFDSTNKKITISTTSPTLLNVLNQGADASTFTGTTKIGGLTITSSGDLTLTGALTISGSATSTFAGPLDIGSGKFSVLASSGNTAVAGTLSVTGQCVTGDTKLRRRRRRRNSKSQNEDEEYIYDEVEIKDIRQGDEIASLDEITGKIVWRKVKALMDMGVKPIFKLTTALGRVIRTTGNHPYFVKTASPIVPKRKPKIGIFFDNANLFYAQKNAGWKIDIKKIKRIFAKHFETVFINYYSAIPDRNDGAYKSTINFLDHIKRYVTLKTKPLKYIKTAEGIEKKGDVDLEIGLDVARTINSLDVVVIFSGDSDYLELRRYVLEKGKKIIFLGFDATMAWEMRRQKHLILDGFRQEIEWGIGEKTTPKPKLGRLLLSLLYAPPPSLSSGGTWRKVTTIEEGQEIAALGKNGKPVWDRVVKIEKLPPEQVYDIEVEGTHNFIGNDIVAHNTYLTGNVGIGDTSPASPLTVGSGDLFQVTSSGFALLPFGTSTTPSLAFTGDTDTGIFGKDNNILAFGTGGTERMRIDASGNVGIGTTSPDQRFVVQNTAVDSLPRIGLYNDARKWTFVVRGDDLDKFQLSDDTAGSIRMTVDSSGNVGIGTTGPGYKLHIAPLAANADIVAEAPSTSYGASFRLLRAGALKGYFYLNNAADDNVYFGTPTKDPAVTFKSDGNVGIGRTAPSNALDVLGNIVAFTDTSTNGTNLNGMLFRARDSGAAPNEVNYSSIIGVLESSGPRDVDRRGAIAFYTLKDGGSPATAERMRITSAGNVGIGTTGPESRVQIAGGGLCVGSDANCNTDNNTEGTVYSAATAMTVYDVAENYPTKDTTLIFTEVVSLDTQNGVFVKRGDQESRNLLLGVVSEKPAVLLGGFNGAQFKEEKQVAIALSGRVPVYVNTEGGDIKIGDSLTISSTPGAAKKTASAGRIIGYALENFPSATATSTIQVFVNVGYQGNDLNATLTGDQQLTTNDEPLIDKNGNQLALTHEGTVVIKRLVVKDLELAKGGTITLPKGEGEVIGYTTIPEGVTYKIVEHSLVKPGSTIFLTLQNTSAPAGISYSVINKKEGQFTINLSDGVPYPLTFAYWILDTYDTSGSIQTSNATSTVQ